MWQKNNNDDRKAEHRNIWHKRNFDDNSKGSNINLFISLSYLIGVSAIVIGSGYAAFKYRYAGHGEIYEMGTSTMHFLSRPESERYDKITSINAGFIAERGDYKFLLDSDAVPLISDLDELVKTEDGFHGERGTCQFKFDIEGRLLNSTPLNCRDYDIAN